MTSASDVFAALRTLDEACGEDDRQFRWRVRRLRDEVHPQPKARAVPRSNPYPYGVRLNFCGQTDLNDPGRFCGLARDHQGPHAERPESSL